MRIHILLALMLVPLSACSLPGMNFDPDTSADEYGIELHVINRELLSEQGRYANFFRDTDGEQALPNVAQLREGYTYTVGALDVLSIVVWQHPELTNPTGNTESATANGRLVRADGTIFFPFVGVVNVKGLTVEEVRRLLVRDLSPYINSPQVDVSVVNYRSRKAYITGEVKEPGIQYLTNEPATLMDAVNRAGGLSALADRRTAVLNRGGERYEINLLELYTEGALRQNVVLQDGDNLHISDNRYNQIFVVGEVTRQASVEMHKGRLTLAEVLSNDKVQGINFSAADASSIYVIRGIRSLLSVPETSVKPEPIFEHSLLSAQQDPMPLIIESGEVMEVVPSPVLQPASDEQNSEQSVVLSQEARVPLLAEIGEVKEIVQPHVFHLDASSPEALLLADRFELMPRDVVFVSTLGISRWNRVIQQISPTLQSVFQVRALQNAL